MGDPIYPILFDGLEVEPLEPEQEDEQEGE